MTALTLPAKLPHIVESLAAKAFQFPHRSSILGEQHGLVENVNGQDELEVAFPDTVTDVEGSSTVGNFRYVLRVENGVQVPRWHTRTPTSRATVHVGCGSLNTGLQYGTKNIFTVSCWDS